MAEQEEFTVEFKTERNGHNNITQKLYFLDENNDHTREVYLSPEQAKQQLIERFDFRSGRKYLISYLTNYQWRSGLPFTYIARRTNFDDHVYNVKTEIEHYGTQAIDDAELHVYAIVVKQMT